MPMRSGEIVVMAVPLNGSLDASFWEEFAREMGRRANYPSVKAEKF
jgi:hypothetical protein